MELRQQLELALAPASEVERELGGGGMSRVFLAREVALDRLIVAKVLPPELAAEMSAERFRREILLAARLQHPHIVPVLSAGTSDALLYYTMPYIEGDSLRERLRKERQLPVDDAVRIAREVAEALDYAHRHGIVHRDIKPENILLEDGHAVVADFGIARALSNAMTGQNLTSTGLVIGSPIYMSPEQASADKEIDGRSDIYSLACVLYEMLTGEPPFTGATPQAVIAKRFSTSAPGVRTTRPSVPLELEEAIARALSLVPVDRFATGADFARAISQSSTGTHQRAASVARRAPSPRAIAVIGVAVIVVAIIGALMKQQPSAPPPVLDANVVAVMPFRATGADPALGYLREGMIDLLAAKLNGEGGPRAVDPRAVISAWRRANEGDTDPGESGLLEIAERLGAGRVLLGGIVGTPANIVITATLLRVPGGEQRVEAGVEGSPDSLPALIDRLTLQLLAQQAGESERLVALTSTSLPTLRSYLEGQAAYREGRYQQAVHHFERSLQVDSNFVLAAIGLFSAAYWTPNTEPFDRGRRIAFEGRYRLSARDRAYVLAWTGPTYPSSRSFKESLAGWQAAVESSPDRAEPWFELGDLYFHFSSMLDVDQPMQRARNAFDRALALDSSFAAPLAHLVELAVVERDTARVRTLGATYFAQDSAADGADYLRWRVALGTNDERELGALRARLPSVSTWSLRRLVGFGQLDGIGMQDVKSAANALRARGSTPSEARLIHFELRNLALNRGRPADALQATQAYAEVEPHEGAAEQLQILDALFAEGDSTAAATAVQRLNTSARAVESERTRLSRVCATALWSVRQGDTRRTAGAVLELEQAGSRLAIDAGLDHEICAALLRVLRAGDADSTASARLARALDKTGTATFGGSPLENIGNIVLARTYANRGEFAKALTAIQRRPYQHFGATYLAMARREEARIAERAGDTERARRALRHFILLRDSPEPSRRASLEEARDTLERLQRPVRPGN